MNGSHGGDALGFLGCCPQENALWPSLPVQVHLEVFAAVKGLRKADTTAAITWYLGGATPGLSWEGGGEDAHTKLRKRSSH